MTAALADRDITDRAATLGAGVFGPTSRAQVAATLTGFADSVAGLRDGITTAGRDRGLHLDPNVAWELLDACRALNTLAVRIGQNDIWT